MNPALLKRRQAHRKMSANQRLEEGSSIRSLCSLISPSQPDTFRPEIELISPTVEQAMKF
jgi:hypothetical protein